MAVAKARVATGAGRPRPVSLLRPENPERRPSPRILPHMRQRPACVAAVEISDLEQFDMTRAHGKPRTRSCARQTQDPIFWPRYWHANSISYLPRHRPEVSASRNRESARVEAGKIPTTLPYFSPAIRWQIQSVIDLRIDHEVGASMDRTGLAGSLADPGPPGVADDDAAGAAAAGAGVGAAAAVGVGRS